MLRFTSRPALSTIAEIQRRRLAFTHEVTKVSRMAARSKARLERLEVTLRLSGFARPRWLQELEALPARLEAGFERFNAAAIKVGALGWTIPLDAPWTCVLALAELDEDGIDEAMVNYFMERDGENLEVLRSKLTRSVLVKRWDALVQESVECIRLGKVQVVVPSLLSALEGVVAAKTDSLHDWPAVLRDLHRLLEQDKALRSSVWASVVAFLSILFARSEFAGEKPGRINRHWILHGRDSGPWTKADSLRLLLAIDTVAEARTIVRSPQAGEAAASEQLTSVLAE